MAHEISNVINQGDTSIIYPSTSTKAFTDTSFYSKYGKTDATGTIKANGCAICALATYTLLKTVYLLLITISTMLLNRLQSIPQTIVLT